MRAKFIKDIQGGRLIYPAGTEIKPLYEHECVGVDRKIKKRWFIRFYLYNRPMWCISGILRSDFEYMGDGKEATE